MMAAVDLTEAELYFSCNAFPCLEVKIPQLQNLVIVGVFQAEKHCRDFGMEIVAKQDLCVQSLLCFFYSFHSTRKRLSIAATSRHRGKRLCHMAIVTLCFLKLMRQVQLFLLARSY